MKINHCLILFNFVADNIIVRAHSRNAVHALEEHRQYVCYQNRACLSTSYNCISKDQLKVTVESTTVRVVPCGTLSVLSLRLSREICLCVTDGIHQIHDVETVPSELYRSLCRKFATDLFMLPCQSFFIHFRHLYQYSY